MQNLSVLFLFVVLIGNALSFEHKETKSFSDLFTKVEEVSKKLKPDEILIVSDIDNTLLKTPQDFGSDQLYEWQAERIKTKVSKAQFTDINEFIEFQYKMMSLTRNLLTEETLPKMIKAVQEKGIKMITLTSRGPFLRSLTEKALDQFGIDFEKSTIMPGISRSFTEPGMRQMSFMNGIFMTSGTDKGFALDYILKKSGKKFKAIFFIDDQLKHTTAVQHQFKDSKDIQLYTFRYGLQDEVKQKLLENPEMVEKQINTFKKLLYMHFL